MVKKKVKSKRQSLGLKYRIKNNIKEYKRKQNRLAKKNPPSKKSKKDPGIPNSWPFKEELLNQIEQERQAVCVLFT
ncbi:GNL3L/Grn1 putative GTPase-domain-containing protein [Zychaea mexicana]|uniref:GNL3L/Grn1 putative GTPase-domain-containing protein n=1 Tax=Zychaea mexicana TaxID=64656 RepID=UPI0022FE010E|nr:GNL3L/Grn1 putative GTPase-domain-containing protein [Zychaea mexicana]KAI9494911.1 GNL3L/Grn1 putative GTPase-domain-containing protein [Zychaea mexicana]